MFFHGVPCSIYLFFGGSHWLWWTRENPTTLKYLVCHQAAFFFFFCLVLSLTSFESPLLGLQHLLSVSFSDFSCGRDGAVGWDFGAGLGLFFAFCCWPTSPQGMEGRKCLLLTAWLQICLLCWWCFILIWFNDNIILYYINYISHYIILYHIILYSLYSLYYIILIILYSLYYIHYIIFIIYIFKFISF